MLLRGPLWAPDIPCCANGRQVKGDGCDAREEGILVGWAEWTTGKNASEASVEEDGKSETGDDEGRWVHGFTRAD